MGMTAKEAIGWLKMQSSKPVKWDDYSEENKQIREEAERRIKEAFNMAIEALKAQEPVEPKKNDVDFAGLRTWEWACPECNCMLIYRAKYCSCCGRAVKWE